MKVEWWYDDSAFQCLVAESGARLIELARLTVHDTDEAELLFPTGTKKYFSTELEAQIWLGDEEYRCLADLVEDFEQSGNPVPSQIKVPEGTSEEDILRGMVIEVSH